MIEAATDQNAAVPHPGRRQIGDYGFLSDCHTAALVDRNGSIDWWCPARFDAPSVFARLLDDGGGHWSLHPQGDYESTRRYVGATLVLRTTFSTNAGEVEVTDALALEPDARGHDMAFGRLVRCYVGSKVARVR